MAIKNGWKNICVKSDSRLVNEDITSKKLEMRRWDSHAIIQDITSLASCFVAIILNGLADVVIGGSRGVGRIDRPFYRPVEPPSYPIYAKCNPPTAMVMDGGEVKDRAKKVITKKRGKKVG